MPTLPFTTLRLQLATAALLIASVPGSVHGQEGIAMGDADRLATERRGPTDPVEVRAFFDGLMAAHMREHDIVGATVTVVRDGEVLFAHGYGDADAESNTPVDPERTMFRIGSVSKLFTWTAVMQQLEAGTVDLDTDVTTYLDFDIPETFEEPITLRHLLTHTPGFEDRAVGLFGPTDRSRRDYLIEHMPARVRPPGTLASYSNYGTTLAGHIVERVAGMSWEDYLDERILRPLGMRYATGHQPIPDAIAADMSTGYANEGSKAVAKDFETIGGQAPAGSVSASALAMARFMLAHLQGGEFEGQRILSAETTERMHQRLFTHDERLPGFAHGFYEQNSHGLRIIGHGGDTQWFHTNLSLIPEEDLGVFVSYNTAAGGLLSFRPFLQLFLDHYYPQPPLPPAVAPDEVDLDRYAGTYLFNRHSYTTFEKVLAMFTPVRITVDSVHLVMASPLGPQRFAPAGDGAFRDVDGSDVLVFREEGDRVAHAMLGSIPMMVLDRVGGLGAPGLHQTVMGIAVITWMLVVVALPVRAWMRRRYTDMHQDSRAERRARWVAWASALSGVAFVCGFALVMSDFTSVLGGNTASIRLVLTVGVIVAVLAVATAVTAGLAWKDGYWTRWARIRYSMLAGLAVAFVLVMHHWNLLGWRLG